MRKKVFGSIVTAVLFVALALSGCNNQMSAEYSEAIPQLEQPTVTTQVYEGIIVVNWSPVLNAVGYRVFRRHEATNYQVELTGGAYTEGTTTTASTGTPYTQHIDIVATDNQFVNGDVYTYIVQAIAPARATGQSTSGTYADPGLILDSEGRAQVTAWIPSRDSYTIAEPANITVEPVLTDETGNLLVTWDTSPNAVYEVTYNFGVVADGINGPQFSTTSGITVTMNKPGFESPKGFATFPMLGAVSGKANSVTVTAKFIGAVYGTGFTGDWDETTNTGTKGSNPYYNSVSAKSQDFQYGLTSLDNVNWNGTFSITSASPDLNTGIEEDYVQFTWPVYQDVMNRTVSYKLYKASFDNTNGAINSATNQPEKGVVTKSGWTEITSKLEYISKSPTSITALEKLSEGAANVGTYLYLLVASVKEGGTTLYTNPKYAVVTPYTSNPITAHNLSAMYYFTDAAETKPAVEISWEAVAGETYELYRAEATWSDWSLNSVPTKPTKIGSEDKIADQTAGIKSVTNAVSGITKFYVQDTGVVARGAYQYKLKTLKAGFETEETKNFPENPYTNTGAYPLESSPFARVVDLSLTAVTYTYNSSTGWITNPNNYDQRGKIVLTPAFGNTWHNDKFTIKVYKRLEYVNGTRVSGTQGNYEADPVATWAKGATSTITTDGDYTTDVQGRITIGSKTYTLPTATLDSTLGNTYGFKAVAILNGIEAYDADGATSSNRVSHPEGTPSFSTPLTVAISVPDYPGEGVNHSHGGGYSSEWIWNDTRDTTKGGYWLGWENRITLTFSDNFAKGQKVLVKTRWDSDYSTIPNTSPITIELSGTQTFNITPTSSGLALPSALQSTATSSSVRTDRNGGVDPYTVTKTIYIWWKYPWQRDDQYTLASFTVKYSKNDKVR